MYIEYNNTYIDHINHDFCATSIEEGIDNAQNTIANIIGICQSKENIYAVRAFEYKGEYVVAILSTPFYLKSERDNCLISVANQLFSTLNITAYTTFDMDIFRNIKEDMTDTQKKALLTELKERI